MLLSGTLHTGHGFWKRKFYKALSEFLRIESFQY